MAVSSASLIKEFHDQTRLTGDKRVSADYSLQIVDTDATSSALQGAWLYCQNQFWPQLTPGEGIEVPTPLGAAMWQPSQVKFHQQAQVTFQETAAGTIQRMFEDLLACAPGAGRPRGRFAARVYYGTPDRYIQYAEIEHCFLTAEPIETGWENRTQIVTIPATIYYHFYGKVVGSSGEECEIAWMGTQKHQNVSGSNNQDISQFI